MQVTVGTADVPKNPDEQHLPLTAPTISIPTESFNPSSGPLVKSYILLFSVKITPEREPALKKRKSNGSTLDNTKLYSEELTNEREKELMKMWNLDVMKCGFVGDCQIPLTCQVCWC